MLSSPRPCATTFRVAWAQGLGYAWVTGTDGLHAVSDWEK